ncbi:HupE/UreJ family protein [Massilia sp. LC238]|uniref:HupE/UreJ family protein n=1 Tax=Massilia sp. LC238 TaxID=1502852 RepID=UPI0009DE1730|nr:HupE/UreJ family protein [Massilia sp. LC238]
MPFDNILSLQCWRRFTCICLLWLAVLMPAHAHDPFEGNVELLVFDHKLEIKMTLGFDAARASLVRAGMTPGAVSTLKSEAARSETGSARLPLTAAAAILDVSAAGGVAMTPSAAHVAFGDMETTYLLIYPRPSTDSVHVTAATFGYIEAMRPMTIVSAGANGRVLSRAVLSVHAPMAKLNLAADSSSTPASGGADMFRLGVQHILEGFDHLLFLGALLLGLRRLRPILYVLTSFTLAHSLTLALAALGVVRPASAIIEPLIAVSIVLACIQNLRDDDGAASRYWMAAGFGLIHGFGFAGALQDELGNGDRTFFVPLVMFNMGVEAGQLLVALPVIAVLQLARRHTGFLRYGQPALSLMVATIGVFWLGQRIT